MRSEQAPAPNDIIHKWSIDTFEKGPILARSGHILPIWTEHRSVLLITIRSAVCIIWQCTDNVYSEAQFVLLSTSLFLFVYYFVLFPLLNNRRLCARGRPPTELNGNCWNIPHAKHCRKVRYCEIVTVSVEGKSSPRCLKGWRAILIHECWEAKSPFNYHQISTRVSNFKAVYSLVYL